MIAHHSVRINGLDEMAIRKLDVLSGLPELKIATSYRLNGKTIKHYPHSSYEFSRVKPVYQTMKGWREDLSGIRRWKDFPVAAKKYLKRLELLMETPIKIVSVGSKRSQTIFV